MVLMDRAELEDRCHQVLEKNQLLKKHTKAQEEKMKRCVTCVCVCVCVRVCVCVCVTCVCVCV